MVMVAVRGAVPWILIWKLSPARKVVCAVRSTDWLSADGAARQAQRVQHAGALGIDRQAGAGRDWPSAPPYCWVHCTLPLVLSAVAKALVTFCTLRCWPAKVPVVDAGEIDRAVGRHRHVAALSLPAVPT